MSARDATGAHDAIGVTTGLARGARRLASASPAASAPRQRERGGGIAESASQSFDAQAWRARWARLDAQRKAMGCAQAELAAALGVSRSTVSRLLRGQASPRPAGWAETPDQTQARWLQRVELALEVLARADRAGDAPNRRVTPARQRHPRAQAPAAPYQPRDARPGASDERRALAAQATRGDYRVLIVEDDADTLALYQAIFQTVANEPADQATPPNRVATSVAPDAAGATERTLFHVEFARTARECLAALKRAQRGAPFDLLLMDLGVGDWRDLHTLPAPAPHSSARRQTLLGQLLQRRALAPARVLIVSGASPYTLRAHEPELQALGAAFLAKPFDIDDLLMCVADLCAGRVPRLTTLRVFAPVGVV